jgi:hypothetical protein
MNVTGAIPRAVSATLTVVLLSHSTGSATDYRLRGWIAPELRGFPQAAAHPGQRDEQYQVSIAASPRFSIGFSRGRNALDLEVFGRWDRTDDWRTHVDIREASWIYVRGDYEIVAGVSKVFWGVTESRHLVDIVNQTDLVERPNGEEKLGEMMVALSVYTSVGMFRGFLLPVFRERSFPGAEGRLRPGYPLPRTTLHSSLTRRNDPAGRFGGAIR